MEKKEKKVLERDIMKDICVFLEGNHIFFWRSNNIPVFGKSGDGQSRFRAMPKFSKKGVPDIIVIHKGKFIGLEVKRPESKLRPDQANFGVQVVDHGGYYYMVTSVEDVRSISELDLIVY